MEFVELYDGGAGNTSLDGLVVVFFNGHNDLSYSSFDLDGYSTDTNGYFVLGNSLVPGVDLIFPNRRLQNGADAVALYEADGTDFPSGTAVTTSKILDAIVYGTDDANDPGLLLLLNGGEPQVNENMFNDKVNHSVQRLPNGSGGFRNTSAYSAEYPTPDAMNKRPVVIDTIAPNVVCKDAIAYLDKGGTASILISEIDNGSNDNCGIDRLTLSRSSFSCSDLGAVANIDKVWVNEIHYDNEGSDVGEFVEIAGTAGIDLSGYNLLFYNGSNGKVYTDFPLYGVIDNEKDGFGALPFFIPDIQNGSPDGVALVSPEDVVIEFISYEGGLTAANGAALGMPSVNIGVSEPSSTTVGYSLQRTGVGSDGGEFIWAGPITGSPGSINTGQEVKSPSGVVITLTGEDINGNVGSCHALVTVIDSIKPTAVCTDINVYVDAGGQATIDPADLDGGSTDNCGIIDWKAGKTLFSCSEIIVHEALWINELHYDNAGGDINEFVEIAGTAGIGLGNFEIYLYNGIDGAVYGSSPLSGVIPDEGNGYGALYFLIPNMQNGAPDGVALVEDGRHLVEFISYEGSILATSGPAAGMSSTDIIVDESSSTPIGFSLQRTGLGRVGNDFVWGGPENSSPGTLNHGQTIDTSTGVEVALSIEDPGGNIGSCVAMVSVLDTIAPAALCRDATIYLDNNGLASVENSMVDNGSYDNCPVYKTRLSQYDFDCSHLGGNNITLAVEGQSGNIGTCLANVKVLDTIAPMLICNPVTVTLFENGEYILSNEDKLEIVEGTTDNCTSFNSLDFVFENISFDCANVWQPDTVKVTAVDNSGNSGFCFAQIVVLDETGPVVGCKDIEVILDESGRALAFPGQLIDPDNTFDACGIDVMEASQSIFTCDDLGKNKVVLTVYDQGGNKDKCKSEVTVIDSSPPEFVNVDDVVLQVEPGICETSVTYPVVTINEACGGTITQAAGLGANAMFPLGVTSETYIAIDENGNTDTLTFSVTVNTYNAPPTIDELPNIEIDEDIGTMVVPLTGITPNIDCSNQSVVSVTAVSDNTGLIPEVKIIHNRGDEDGTLELHIAADKNGVAEVAITVADNGGTENGGLNTTTETFMVTVLPVNDPPVLVAPIPDQSVNAANPAAIPVSCVLGELFDDIDEGDAISVSATLEGGFGLPLWLTLSNDTIKGVPLIADTGCYDITVTATDLLGATCNDNFTLCVDGYLTGVDALTSNPEVYMYPNPTEGKVILAVKGVRARKVEVAVNDITGKEVFREKFIDPSLIECDLGGYMDGLYLVTISTESKMITRKLIVRHQ